MSDTYRVHGTRSSNKIIGEMYREGEFYVHSVMVEIGGPVFGFSSRKPRKHLLDGAVAFLDRTPDGEYELIQTAVSTKYEWEVFKQTTEKVLDRLEGTPEECALQFIIWSTGAITSMDEIKLVAISHLEYWRPRQLKTESDILKYLSPVFSRWGDATFAALLLTHTSYRAPASLLRRLSDSKTREFFNKVARIDYKNSTGQNWEYRLRHLDVTRSKVLSNTDFHTLPFHHEDFREYLDGLRVREFSFLVGKIPINTPPKAAIEMAEGLIRSQEVEGSITLARECYEAASAATEPFEDVEYWIDVYTILIENWEKAALIKLVTLYFRSRSPKSVSHKETRSLLDSLFLNHLKWIKTRSHAGNVTERLLELTGSPERTVQIIRGVEDGESNPTLEQWNTYLGNWEEYKDTPPQLLMDLL